MLIKTHLAITLFFIILFLPSVENQLAFIPIALLATYLPDIDSPTSKAGNHWYLRPLQWFAGHRKFVHSFTFLFLITIGLVLIFPILALPFFLGYSSHLIADSFTIEGIKPFYPNKRFISGKIRTGGISETTIFTIFVILNLVVFMANFSNMF